MPEWFDNLFSWDGITVVMSFSLPLFIAWLALMPFAKKNDELNKLARAKSAKKAGWHTWNLNRLIWIACGLSLFGAFAQFMAFTQHRTYDTDAIKYYDEKFNKMEQKRISAATALKEYYQKGNWDLVTNSTDRLDDVLGFWDNLGYDEQHGKISAEVAWNYFYDDIADYYQGSLEYIAISQKEDPTWFENIKPLFDDVTKIEAQRRHRQTAELRISGTNYLEYLRSEIDLEKGK
jgi:hypothetical protein